MVVNTVNNMSAGHQQHCLTACDQAGLCPVIDHNSHAGHVSLVYCNCNTLQGGKPTPVRYNRKVGYKETPRSGLHVNIASLSP